MALRATLLYWAHLTRKNNPQELVPKKYSTRVIAVGDLHGDFNHAQRVLRYYLFPSLASRLRLQGQCIGWPDWSITAAIGLGRRQS